MLLYIMKHIQIMIVHNEFKIGDKIKQEINKSNRILFAKLHSVGHLIDVGMNIIGKALNINFILIYSNKRM